MMVDPAAAEGTEPNATAQRSGALTPRLALSIAACAVGALLAYTLLGYVLHDILARGVIAALLAIVGIGWALQSAVVAPLVARNDELQDRYVAALADALRDPLTALGNHRAFQEELDRQVEQAQRYDVPVSLVLIDIDEFKAINDKRGHAEGDRALADFGRLVKGAIRRVDRPFRVGGDEFAILLPHTDAEGAWIVVRRILAGALQPPLREMGHRPISFSAGISSLPGLATSRAQLYSQADAALYAAKRAGRTDVIVFDPASAAAPTSASSSAAIAEVIARGLLRPVYQPIINLSRMTAIGYEGLIRPVPPAPFSEPLELFEAAAASGHLVALDLSCIETIIAGAGDLPRDAFLCVNISPRTVESPEFSTPALLSILARHGFDPHRLVLELTEREAIEEVERVRAKLEACRVAGISLAADDVGAGNAGLRLLSELRFEVIKVDLSLVQRSAPGAPSSAVIESVVALAAKTGSLVVGEGVEQAVDMEHLKKLGVTAAQGFFFSHPGPLAPMATPTSEAVMERAVVGVHPTNRVVIEDGDGSGMAAWRQSIGLPTPVG